MIPISYKRKHRKIKKSIEKFLLTEAKMTIVLHIELINMASKKKRERLRRPSARLTSVMCSGLRSMPSAHHDGQTVKHHDARHNSQFSHVGDFFQLFLYIPRMFCTIYGPILYDL